ncbi:OPT oligopeptide transporter protein-domain-containing protein, partial [Mortierella sp. GBAus27b]
RAAIVGSLLGCVVAASNLYLGLKIGWTFGAALWGSIFGFLILKSMSRLTGSIFGPKENGVCQAAATSAGGLSNGFVTAIPAMYRMGLMGDSTPQDDVVALLLWTASAAFFGMFFAVPLRSHFVINQDLVFPTPRAAAETIKNLHRAGSAGAKDARDSGIAMAVSFVIAMGWSIVGFFIPGIFGTIHILYYIGKAANYTNMMDADAKWGWAFSWDFAFFGAGLMTPASTVFSFMLGELIAFGIAGPIMTSTGYLTGRSGFPPPPAVGSAQSWFLWPGVGMMVFTAFSELGARGPSLYHGIKGGVREIRNMIRKLQKKEALVDTSGYVSKDTTPEHELIPTVWWLGALLASAVFTILVMYFYFHVPVYATIGAIILSFLLAFVGLQASGETDINPTGAVAKVTQLVFSRIPNNDLMVVQKTNLMCANIAASVCSQAVDMVGDLKTGQLIGASPRAMLGAQLVGSVFAIGIAIPLFILYTKAYPCVLDASAETCQFAVPAVVAWENVCKILTGDGSVPRASMILTIVCCILGIINVVIRVKFLPDSWKPYWINLNAVGLGFINPSPSIVFAMLVGWTAGWIWKRVNIKSHERLMYSVSAGLIAGVGIAGLINAAMTIAGVDEGPVKAGCGHPELKYALC